jgi:hypothetical protein
MRGQHWIARVTPEAASMLITLAIEKSHPLTGTASCDERGTVAFAGWMELLRAVADLVGTQEPTPDGHRSEGTPRPGSPGDNPSHG